MKKTKFIKFINIWIISLVFIFLMVPPAFTGDNVEMPLETAINIATERLDIPENFKLSSSYLTDYDEPCWELNFDNYDRNNPQDISVTIYVSNGLIREYENHDSGKSDIPKISEDKARENAINFIKRQLPLQYYNQIYLSEKSWDNYSDYEFYFNRSVNGYPYLYDYIRIVVNGDTGLIHSYNLNWSTDNNPLPDERPKLSMAEVSKKFHSEIGLQLGYVAVSDPANSQDGYDRAKLILGYYPRVDEIEINAINGELISWYGEEYNNLKKAYQPIDIEAAIPVKRGPFNRNEAESIARDFGKVPTEYKIKSFYNFDNTWNFKWVSNNNPDSTISVTIDDISGELIDLKNYLDEDKVPANKINKTQAKNLALEFMAKTNPSALDSLQEEVIVSEEDSFDSPYEFYFPQIVNDLPIQNCGIEIVINEDGSIISYDARIWSGVVPAKDKVISESTAREIFDRWNIKSLSYLNRGSIEKPILAYQLYSRGHKFVDATTGQYRDFDGIDNILLELYAYGSASREIRKLINMGIINEEDEPLIIEEDEPFIKVDGPFLPTKPISRVLLSKLLVRTLMLNLYYPETPSYQDVGRDNTNFGFIEAVNSAGIFKGIGENFKPDQPLTREEAAVYMSKIVLGNGNKQAKSPVIKDIDSVAKSSQAGVIKAVSLGLLRCNSKGLFQPKQEITGTDVAVMLCKLIDYKSRLVFNDKN